MIAKVVRPKKVVAKVVASKVEQAKASSEEEKSFDLSAESYLNFGSFLGHRPGFVLFSGVDEEVLGCLPDRAEARIVNTSTKSIDILKLENELSNYRK
jgi:hypothetical protein